MLNRYDTSRTSDNYIKHCNYICYRCFHMPTFFEYSLKHFSFIAITCIAEYAYWHRCV